MGVWIETLQGFILPFISESHPAWVCGLKRPIFQKLLALTDVTPCVGVWIETVVIDII